MLIIENLSIQFRKNDTISHALSDVSLTIDEGQTVGMVGESGSGKSVTALAVMGLHPPKPLCQIQAKSLVYKGQNLLTFSAQQWQKFRGKEVAMVFQDPMLSLNPLIPCGEQISETMRWHLGMNGSNAKRESVLLLERMGFQDPARSYTSYPYELSGGMKQRVLIAIALACKPRLLIADEPTTALDVTVQAQILDLIREQQKQLGMALLLVSHDLGLISRMVEKVHVLYGGQMVESGPVKEIVQNPNHPYTRALLKSIPPLDNVPIRLPSIPGVVPSPSEKVSGCRFHPRCPDFQKKCEILIPPLHMDSDRQYTCHMDLEAIRGRARTKSGF